MKPNAHSVHEVIHLSFEEIRAAAHDLAQHRREARADYERYIKKAADAERDYRRALAIEFTRAKAGGAGVGEAEIRAQGAVSTHRHERDVAQGMAKAALLRIEELEADRAMLRQLGDWSRGLETVG